MTRTAVINQKGGVGKTTTTVNLGAALTRLGKTVLLLDLDPQSNMTLHLDRRPDEQEKTITNLFLDGAGVADLIQETSTSGLYLLPADTSLAGVEQALANRIGRETLLREALDAYSGDVAFDCLLIDCPPSLGVLSANALVASDQVLIPVQAEYLALQGMAKLTEVIQLVQRRLNPSLRVACILPCMVDLRTNLAAEVVTEIRQHFGTLLASNLIRANVKLAEAPSFGRTIFQHAPECNGASDYHLFAEEFLKLEQTSTPGAAEPEVEPQAVDAMETQATESVEPSAGPPEPGPEGEAPETAPALEESTQLDVETRAMEAINAPDGTVEPTVAPPPGNLQQEVAEPQPAASAVPGPTLPAMPPGAADHELSGEESG